MAFKGKKAVVFGFGKSGQAAASALSALGAEVLVTDKRLGESLKGEAVLPRGVRLIAGRHDQGVADGADLVVVSPGVPMQISPIQRAIERGTEVIGEFELAYRLLKGLPFYAVTGTNGKSTVCTLLDLMMRKSGRWTVFGGNIGNPLSAEAPPPTEAQCVVAEVSSFQLESTMDFRPCGAALLNVTADHLDRYASFDAYRATKERIFKNQGPEDFMLINRDDPEAMKADSGPYPGRKFYFSRTEEVEGVFLKGTTVYANVGSGGPRPLIEAREIGIKGVHNLENALAASAMALLAHCPEGPVVAALREFFGLPHRLEFVREVGGVRYVNDSKGTNVGAVTKSLEGFFDSQVVLIAGGRDKDSDFSTLRHRVKDRVKEVVLIGEAGRKIERALSGHARCVFAVDMQEAVNISKWAASPGDVVLLSPACASFDMFSDYAERGEKFKEAVNSL